MGKFGDRFVEDMVDRGRREVGAVFYTDSTIAQPLYPLRGGGELAKQMGSSETENPTLADRLQEPAVDDPGPDRDRDEGIERD